MTAGDFDALFDRFHASVVRLEALASYDVGGAEADQIRAWRAGEPRPERSVRTSPWLARIAVSTVVHGKRWRRVRVVDDPMSDYQRWQLTGYAESQAAGEEIRIAWRADVGYLTEGPDVWLFDADSPDAYAAVMNYDDHGHWLGFEVVHGADVAVHAARAAVADEHAVPLNEFLTGLRAH